MQGQLISYGGSLDPVGGLLLPRRRSGVAMRPWGAIRRRSRTVVAPGHVEHWGPYDIAGIGSRGVRVYVPSGDVEREAERSVVVLFDGQNVFGDQGSFCGGWHAHRAADRIATRKRLAPIVVGVEHGHADRLHELSPFAAHGSRGQLDRLVDFLRGRLASDVRTRFGTPADPSRWLVGGSSLGGLAALHAHYTAPEVFGGALCMSPSFWLGGRRFFEWLESHPLPWTSRLYLDAGVYEGSGTAARLGGAAVRVLRRRGYGPERLRWKRDPRGRHTESSWRRRLPGAMRFLLS